MLPGQTHVVAHGCMDLLDFHFTFRGLTTEKEQTIGHAPTTLRPRWRRQSFVQQAAGGVPAGPLLLLNHDWHKICYLHVRRWLEVAFIFWRSTRAWSRSSLQTDRICSTQTPLSFNERPIDTTNFGWLYMSRRTSQASTL